MDTPINQNPAPIAPQPPVAAEKSSLGGLVGAGIVLVLVALGGLYFWGMQLNKGAPRDELPLILGDTESLPPTSSSDTVADIEADIVATDLGTFETEVDAELRAAESAL